MAMFEESRKTAVERSQHVLGEYFILFVLFITALLDLVLWIKYTTVHYFIVISTRVKTSGIFLKQPRYMRYLS